MPASGKSSIGKIISAHLGFDFFDLDKLIVEREGMTIPEIFEMKGEDYFRTVERDCLSDMLEKEHGFVLATGGGAPCFFDNMQKMNAAGVTIFLNVALEDLYNKLSKKGTKKRPLLKGKAAHELMTELETKFAQRKQFYEQAKISLNQRFSEVTDRANQVIFAIKSLEE